MTTKAIRNVVTLASLTLALTALPAVFLFWSPNNGAAGSNEILDWKAREEWYRAAVPYFLAFGKWVFLALSAGLGYAAIELNRRLGDQEMDQRRPPTFRS